MNDPGTVQLIWHESTAYLQALQALAAFCFVGLGLIFVMQVGILALHLRDLARRETGESRVPSAPDNGPPAERRECAPDTYPLVLPLARPATSTATAHPVAARREVHP
jgi:hypothetical protein